MDLRYKAIIIGKSGQHLSDMCLKLWLIGEWKCFDIKFSRYGGYNLLDPVDVGDFVELYDGGGPIRRLPPGSELPKTRILDGSNGTRSCLKVKVNFMPLDFLLFPASAKEKNLRMAMSAELGPIPIANENSFKLHCFYRGVATLFFAKDSKEEMIAEVYNTPWLIKSDGASLAESDFSTIVHTFAFCQSQDVHRQGLVVDASLKDVFFVHCAELPEMVSLRKDITGGRIAVGDWIEFVSLDVQEAEKSDDRRKIFPADSDNMSVFKRSIACCPDKIKPFFPTSTSGGNTQLTVPIKVPINPPYNGTYTVEQLGKVGDQNGLIGVKHEGRTISVLVQCKVNIEQNFTSFNISGIEQQKPLPPPPPTCAAPSAGHGTFLQNIERGAQQPQQQQKQTLRLSHLTANTALGGSGKRTEGAVADENADPNDAFGQRHQQQPHEQPWLRSQSPPPLISTRVPRRKPTNCIELETIVVEAVTGRGVHSPHVFCFCYDCSQKPNNYIIRIGLNEVDELPTPGQWVRVVMKQEVHGKRVDYSLWEAQNMSKAKHETDFTIDNGIRTVLVRVPLKVSSGGGFYNQFLGPVSDIKQRVKIPTGKERRFVNAWCRKVMPLSICTMDGLCHWEIAPLPEEEWHDEPPLKLPPAESKPIKTIFKVPFVGSRYRSQPTTTEGQLAKGTTPPMPQTSQQQQIQQPMTISKPNQHHNANNTGGGQCANASLSPALGSSGFGSSASSNASAQVERDLIDLFDEKCSIGPPLKWTPSPPPLQQHQFSGVMYPHTGVIASMDLKSRGYYVYSNEFDNELYLLTEELLEKGSWIKFNILDDYYRLIIGQYALLKKSPFDVRVERNTIYMCVSAYITPEALTQRIIDTSYVKNVYDRCRLLQHAHVGKELKLEVKRGKVDGFCWTISRIMKIGN
ncbi:hypothetical protein niasHT_028144 [Heterodera trifolii]|uniref:Uncharacterized protein n=1 Tax=Heterodera trifolii TaxID=157864 RepID=A0ABD2JNR5_9BILA